MYKLPSFNTFVICFWISALAGAFLFLIACNAPNPQPSVQNDRLLHQECDKAYQDAEYIIDSLYERNQELEAQLAGCEFQDHSKLTEYAATK